MHPAALSQRFQAFLSTFGGRAPRAAVTPRTQEQPSILLRPFQGVTSFEAPAIGRMGLIGPVGQIGSIGIDPLTSGDALPMVPKLNLVDDYIPDLVRRRPRQEQPMPKTSGEKRTRLEALQDANALLLGQKWKVVTAQGSVVTRDPDDPNLDADRHSTLRSRVATAQLEANGALEKKYLNALTPEQRDQYASVNRYLEGDPVAKLAFQALLFKGRLTKSNDPELKTDALSQLADVVNQPLAEGVNRRRLITDMVQELACPASISQRNRGTCAATAVEMKLIHDNPAEYVRLVAGLASPEGKATLASGQTIQRVKGTNLEDGTGRSLPQRLLAPAFMDLANGSMVYSNKTDCNYHHGKAKSRGLTPGQVDRLLEAVFSEEFTCKDNIDTGKERKDAWSLLQKATEQGQEVLAGMQWTPSTRHKVVVVGVSKTGVAYLNPWGRLERMDKDRFLGRLHNLNYLTDFHK